jgi:MFS superfamily sulfate permease-like transporter
MCVFVCEFALAMLMINCIYHVCVLHVEEGDWCRQLSLGPDIMTSQMFGNAIAAQALHHSTPGDLNGYAFLLAFLIGLILFLLGLFRLGFLQAVVSHTVLRSLLMALAINVIISQMPALFGIEACLHNHCHGDDSSIQHLIYFFQNWSSINVVTVVVSFTCLAVLMAFRCISENSTNFAGRFAKAFPIVLVVVILSTVLCAHFKLQNHGVDMLGNVVGGLNKAWPPAFPKTLTLKMVSACLSPAFTIALLIFVESSLIAQTFSTKHRYLVSSNRELVGIGLSNLFGAFFNCFAVSASLSRSKVLDMTGTKTPLANLFCGLIVIICILFCEPLLSAIPKCVMAAINVHAIASLVSPSDFTFLVRMRAWNEVTLFIVIFLATLLLGVDNAILLAFGACVVLLIKNISEAHPELVLLGRDATGRYLPLPSTKKTLDNPDDIAEPTSLNTPQPLPHRVIMKLQGPLHFANIKRIQVLAARVQQELDSGQSKATALPGVAIFDMTDVSSIDLTALLVFSGMLSDYHKQHRVVLIVGLRDAITQQCVVFSIDRPLSSSGLAPRFSVAFSSLITLDLPENLSKTNMFQQVLILVFFVFLFCRSSTCVELPCLILFQHAHTPHRYFQGGNVDLPYLLTQHVYDSLDAAVAFEYDENAARRSALGRLVDN